jgi:hypothetical protein
MSRTQVFGNRKHNAHGTLALASPAGGLRTRNHGGIAALEWLCEPGKRKGESCVEDRRESKRRSKGKDNAHGVGPGGSFSREKMDISSVPTPPVAGESSPERPILSRNRVPSLPTTVAIRNSRKCGVERDVVGVLLLISMLLLHNI